MIDQPWSFEPFELASEQTWVVYDENLARIVAVFYDKGEAKAYLKWRNKKQSKNKAAQRVSRSWLDDDGRC